VFKPTSSKLQINNDDDVWNSKKEWRFFDYSVNCSLSIAKFKPTNLEEEKNKFFKLNHDYNP